MALILPEWITDDKWHAMCNVNMGVPEPLETADLTKPYVYDRAYCQFHK